MHSMSFPVIPLPICTGIPLCLLQENALEVTTMQLRAVADFPVIMFAQ